MRTKTLLVTAALGAVGVTSAIAQVSVYSVNAVGYVNKMLLPGFNMVANPLDAGAGKNTVGLLFAGSPDGTTVYKFLPVGGYAVNDYSDLLGWSDANMSAAPGEGLFVKIPAGPGVNITFVGEVMQGPLTMDLPSGFAMVASKVPQAGKVATDLKYPVADGDTVYKFITPQPNAQPPIVGGYEVYDYSDLLGWSPSEPVTAVGEAFWSKKSVAVTWSRTFSVNTP